MKTYLKSVLLVVSLLLLLPQVRAQDAAPAEEMRKLDFLLGRWEGEGWMMVGPGQRHTARVVETAQRKLDGNVLMVEGLGKARIDDKEQTVHSALGIVTYDRQAKAYKMRAYRLGGNYVDADVTVSEKQMVWSFTEPRAGRIRFTMTVNSKGEWFEYGEASRDEGKTWFKFMEMTLTKKD